MADTFETKLQRYAELTVRVGLNLQPGQRLVVLGPGGQNGVPLEAAPLVRRIAQEAYRQGARFVDVMWGDEDLRRIRFENAPRDSFDEYPTWQASTAFEYAQRGDAVLIISGSNPGLLAGQDPDLVSQAQRSGSNYTAPFSTLLSANGMNWSVVAYPGQGWASVVLPDLPADERQARLWDVVFHVCRADQPDPVAAWEEHLGRLRSWCDYLNARRFAALNFRGPGTDLTIGLPDGHVWGGGRMTSQTGIPFTANVPTEEVATMPHRERVDGVVAATRPLPYGGALIENFSVTFEKGRVVNVAAERGEEVLRQMVATDEGAARLGEVALVPTASPIFQSGLTFFNILFDENAASHIALGRAYRFSVQDGEKLLDEEFRARGGNTSAIHVDFMIGSGAVDVDGLRADGSAEPVMRQGVWAFEA
ncbi:MAG: aminopeptidase [Anaerolineae bacterium]